MTRISLILTVSVAMFLAAGGPARSQEAQQMPATAMSAAAAKDAPRQNDTKTSYVVLKGGAWSMQDKDIKDPDTGDHWELAFGGKMNRYVGGELGFGYLSTDGKLLFIPTKTTVIPVNLSLRIGIPISLVEPYALLGGGLYISMIEVGSESTTTARLGYHSGLGIDVNLGSVVVGIEGRYFVIRNEVFGQTVDLDGTTIALKAGIRF